MIRTSLLRLRRDQSGIALPTVMASLALTGLLATTTLAVTLDGNTATAKDRDAKRATAAAQAALDLGYLRLTTVKPQAVQCVTDGAVSTAGECPEYTEPAASAQHLGNGAEMHYVVGKEGAAGCSELPGDPRTAAEKARDRCITARGSVNDVERRVQTRVRYNPPWQPFMVAGLVARNNVDIRNDDTVVNTSIGANGRVTVANGADVNGLIQLGPACGPSTTPSCDPEQPAGTWSYTTGGTNVAGTPVTAPQRFEFPAIDEAFANAWTTRDNSDFGSYFNSSTNAFAMGVNPPPLLLDGATYAVCSFSTAQGADIRVRAGQVARIFVDSPRRPGSPCRTDSAPDSGQGAFVLGNESKLNFEQGQNPRQLELYVYGTTADTASNPDISIGNAATFYGAVYAPDSSLLVDNGGVFRGAATVKNATIINNADFINDSRVNNITLEGTGDLDRKSWVECTAARPVPADMESGC